MDQEQQRERHEGAIKFGDVFEMSGEMAQQPISPRDAAAMQSAENRAFGKTIKGGPASIMLQAAAKNLESGLVGPDDTPSTFTDDGNLVEGDSWQESQPSQDQLESSISVEGMVDDEAAATGTTAAATGSGLAAAAQAAATLNTRD